MHLQDCEKRCQPCLFSGAVSQWPAIQRWKGQTGLQHLAKLAGTAQVQAMITADKEGLFFGNMRQFAPHNCSFKDFLSDAGDVQTSQVSASNADSMHGLHSYQAYLAQASLDPEAPLAPLRKDFTTPQIMSHVNVTATNLWMSIRGSRSSLHHDPYHNLLCLVQGKKTVKLMSPEVTHQLYPLSVLGESPNHSHVNFAHPDFEQHPLYKQALEHQQEFVLQAGDALFIPEGWWHQVDSQDTTIAVNFWWHSAFAKSLVMQPHMHQYYLRRVVDGLLDSQRAKALAAVMPHPELQTLKNAAGGHSGRNPPFAPVPSASSASSEDDTTSSTTSANVLSSPEVTPAATCRPSVPPAAAATAAAGTMQADRAVPVTAGSHSASAPAQPPAAAVQAGTAVTEAPLPPIAAAAEALGIQAMPSVSSTTAAGMAAMAAAAAAAASAAVMSTTAFDLLQPASLQQRHSYCRHQDASLQCQPSHAEADEFDSSAMHRQEAEHSNRSLSSQRPHRKRKACDMSGDPQHGPAESVRGADHHHQPDHSIDVAAAVGSRESGSSGLEGSPLCLAAMQLLAAAVPDALNEQSVGQTASGSNGFRYHAGVDHPITRIFAALSPQETQAVLALMVRHVPCTLEALLLHALPPAAAELLTQKLEQADAERPETGNESQQRFYHDLYGVTEEPQKALHAVLDKKEAFSKQLCQGPMSQLLGISCMFD